MCHSSKAKTNNPRSQHYCRQNRECECEHNSFVAVGSPLAALLSRTATTPILLCQSALPTKPAVSKIEGELPRRTLVCTLKYTTTATSPNCIQIGLTDPVRNVLNGNDIV